MVPFILALALALAPEPIIMPATPEQLGMKTAPAQPSVSTQTAQGKLRVVCSAQGIATFYIGRQIVGRSHDCTGDMPGATHSRLFKATGEQLLLVQTATSWLANGAIIRIAPKEPVKVVYLSPLAEFTGITAANRIGYAVRFDGRGYACEAAIDWKTGHVASRRKLAGGPGNPC